MTQAAQSMHNVQYHKSNPNINYNEPSGMDEYQSMNKLKVNQAMTPNYGYLSNYEIENLYDMTPDYQPNNGCYTNLNSNCCKMENSDFLRPRQNYVKNSSLKQNSNLQSTSQTRFSIPSSSTTSNIKNDFQPQMLPQNRFNSFTNLNHQTQEENWLQCPPCANKTAMNWKQPGLLHNYKTPEVCTRSKFLSN